MSNKPRFRNSVDNQDAKLALENLKSGSQHLYHDHLSLKRKLRSKKFLLLTCQIFGLLLKILAAHEKYPVLNRDNLTIPIHKKFSQKQKAFSQIFPRCWKSRLNFKSFQ